MADKLEFEVDRSRGRVVVLRVRGRIDGRSAPDLMKRGLEEQAPDRTLILNLSEIGFVSSAGVGALMVLSDTASRQGGSVRLPAPSDAVMTLLKLLNLHNYLAIDATESAALGAMGA